MQQSRSLRTLVVILSAQLITLGFVQSAGAGVVPTETAIELQQRDARIERINAVLSRDSVQQKLVAMGVNPRDAQARIATLSNNELVLLEQRMNDLPAGADSALAVLGIVLLVLLVLELVGVTDVFKSL